MYLVTIALSRFSKNVGKCDPGVHVETLSNDTDGPNNRNNYMPNTESPAILGAVTVICGKHVFVDSSIFQRVIKDYPP